MIFNILSDNNGELLQHKFTVTNSHISDLIFSFRETDIVVYFRQPELLFSINLIGYRLNGNIRVIVESQGGNI